MKYLIYLMVISSIGFITSSNLLFNVLTSRNLLEKAHTNSQNINNPQIEISASSFPDFANFKYQQFCGERNGSPFLMKNGTLKNKDNELLFAGVKFEDVTKDNNDEAIVILDVISGGSSMPRCVYIFQSKKQENKKVELIYSFLTGDRAYGGIRDIYGENGNLVIERYISQKYDAACCPSYYNIEKYNWENNKFKKISEEQFTNTSKRYEPKLAIFNY